jgi:hypothetical protein
MAACSGGALNQGIPTGSTAGPAAQPSARQNQQPRPMFTVLPYRGLFSNIGKAGSLATWNGSFPYNGHTYNYTMVGANPANSNTTTTIPVAVIPLKIVIGSDTFGVFTKLPNGQRVMKNFLQSPLFQNNVDFVQGGTDLGKTQYIDAFQRGNFWSSVSTNTNYHLVLKPTLAKTRILMPGSSGTVGMEFGVKVGLVDINYIDNQLQSIITALAIPPSTLPLFITRDVYETQGGCCIGGYHSYNGTNTYAIATYVDKPGAFSQDVSAFSHELGEWVDDPYTNNGVACGILEVGDPLERNSNYGGYPYTVNGFTYNLQDLVFLPYFGAPPSTSVNDFFTFQGESLRVCQNGG